MELNKVLQKVFGDTRTDLQDVMVDELKNFNKDFQACFLATIFVETNGLQYLTENLNYSEAGLKKTFPKYFVDRNPKDYAKQPEKIANLVYGNRMGNGDEYSGDGYRYRGRGIIQLTGKNNYVKYESLTGLPLVSNPDILVNQDYATVRVAVKFFMASGAVKYANSGDIKSVSGIVNAGNPNAKTIHGLDDRIKKFNEIKKLLGE